MAARSYNWNKLKNGYYDENGNLRNELIVDEADKLGEILAVKDRLSKSQLRNFFNEVKALDAKIERDNFDENLPYILMLKAKASYAYKGGRNSNIPKSFKEFIETNIDLIEEKRDIETFRGFVNFFETVVAYFYGHGGESNR